MLRPWDRRANDIIAFLFRDNNEGPSLAIRKLGLIYMSNKTTHSDEMQRLETEKGCRAEKQEENKTLLTARAISRFPTPRT